MPGTGRPEIGKFAFYHHLGETPFQGTAY